MTRKIDVIIPAHNEAALIGETIKSIYSQKFSGDYQYNIMIIANACTDETITKANQMIESFDKHDALKFSEISEVAEPGKLIFELPATCDSQ